MTYPVSTSNNNNEEHRRQLADAINLILNGRLNCTGTFTITSGATSTVVNNVNAYASSVPLLIPTQSTTLQPYVSARSAGSFTLSHAAAPANTTYLYALLG